MAKIKEAELAKRQLDYIYGCGFMIVGSKVRVNTKHHLWEGLELSDINMLSPSFNTIEECIAWVEGFVAHSKCMVNREVK